MKPDKELNRKRIRQNTWQLSFKKGIKSWLLLVAVCFIFSFAGSSNSTQTSFLDAADKYLGLNTEYVPKNTEVLNEYIFNSSIKSRIPLLSDEYVMEIVDILSKKHTWFVNLLAANFAYFKRNSGEVIVYLIIVSVISFIFSIFIQNTFNIGKARYFMENRYAKQVNISRIFAPFHKKDILHITWVMVRYHISMFLWSFTLFGYFYKYYQYIMIPYLLAENPKLSWKEAKTMSAKMTKGYKWQIFVTELSCFYMYILELIPFVGLLAALPYKENLHSEIYFTLRDNVKDDEAVFIEKGFDGKVYTGNDVYTEPEYLLKDVVVSPKELRENIKTDIKRNYGHYTIYDYAFFFFVFCFMGWAWEVLLHIVESHELVNRGTMYGPWLPIYGIGGTLIIFLLDRFKANKIYLFLLTIIICAVLEYISSWILDFFCNSSYWDYKDMFLNVNGRICLAGLIAFGLGGQFGIYIAAPRLSTVLDKLGKRKTQLLCISLIALFIADGICCLLFGLNSGAGVGGMY